MALWVCAGCSTRYAPGAPACPHCGSTDRTEQGGSVLPSLLVACGTAGCPAEGRPRRVHLRPAAPGVLEVPTLACATCGQAMRTVEDTMPKITRHGGPTNAAADTDASTGTPAAATTPGGSEQPSPGNSSETSPEKQPSTPETSRPARPRRARTTGNRSGRGRAESSTADTTATPGPKTAADADQ